MNSENKVPEHFLFYCPEYIIKCDICKESYKRSKFNIHKCIKPDPKKIEQERLL